MAESFMSYHPDPYVRSYTDRGTMKWLGFYLSEHTAQMQLDKNERTTIVPRYQAMTTQDCLVVLFESYQQRRPVQLQLNVLVAEGQSECLLTGIVMGIEDTSLFLLTDDQKMDILDMTTIKYVAFLSDSKWSDLR